MINFSCDYYLLFKTLEWHTEDEDNCIAVTAFVCCCASQLTCFNVAVTQKVGDFEHGCTVHVTHSRPQFFAGQ